MRSVRKPLVGKCRIASRDQPVTIASKMSSMSRPQEDLAAGEIDPVDVRVLANERDDLVRRQLVGRLALPDVAGLALVLAPVGETQVEFEGSGRAMRGRPQQRGAEMSRALDHFGFSSWVTRSMSQGL